MPEKLQRRQPENKRPLRSISFLFRRAAANKQIKMVPYQRPPLWRFGGQGPGFANAGTRAKGRTVEVGHVSTTLQKSGSCQPDLVKSLLYWSAHIASSATAFCSVSSWSRISDASWAAFALSGRPRTDLQRFLPKPENTVCQTRPIRQTLSDHTCGCTALDVHHCAFRLRPDDSLIGPVFTC